MFLEIFTKLKILISQIWQKKKQQNRRLLCRFLVDILNFTSKW